MSPDYPIVTRVDNVAAVFDKRIKPQFAKEVERLLNSLSLSDEDADRVFEIATEEERFPLIWRFREIAHKMPSSVRARARRTHVSFSCNNCGTRYAIEVTRLEKCGEMDRVSCGGVIRIPPRGTEAYNYEVCEAEFSVPKLHSRWIQQGRRDWIDVSISP